MADKVALGGLLISDLVFGTELAGTALGYLGLGATATYFGYEMTRERNDLTGIQGRPIISS